MTSSRAEERPYSLFHADPFLQLFPCHVGPVSQPLVLLVMFSLPLPTGCLDGSREYGLRVIPAARTITGSLSVVLSTARDTKQLDHVLGNSDGKAAAVYKLSNGQGLVSLILVRQRQQLQVWAKVRLAQYILHKEEDLLLSDRQTIAVFECTEHSWDFTEIQEKQAVKSSQVPRSH